MSDLNPEVLAAISSATVSIGRDGRGSGIVIAPGVVLTNVHNLRDRTTSITFSDGRRAQARVSATDPDGDLATLAVDTGTITPLTWSDEDVRPGQFVLAGGAGGQQHRVTAGYVSAAGRSFRTGGGRQVSGAVEHTAPLTRGSSGGPLTDAAGGLLGINTHRVGRGFYLARVDDAATRQRIDQLLAGQSVSPRRLGVALAPEPVARRLRAAVGLPERDGLLVRAVSEGSPAGAAGVREGDLLVRAGASELVTIDDLAGAIDVAGDRVTLAILRGADELTVEIRFDADVASGEPDAPTA